MYHSHNDAFFCADPWPRKKFYKHPDFSRLVTTTVMQAYSIAPEQMNGASRGVARVALARQVAMYLTHVVGGFDYAEVGRLFARDRTTVKHACAVVEDRRDDPRFDRTLHLLEGIIEHLCGVTTRPEEMALEC